jgi:hypothetical protein
MRTVSRLGETVQPRKPQKPQAAKPAQESKAAAFLRQILRKDARSGAHAFCVAHAVGIYPA